VNLLREEGFLDDSRGLELVNIEMLFNRWRGASQKAVREVPMRWIIPGDREGRLSDAIRAYVKKLDHGLSGSGVRRSQSVLRHPRVCLGLFAAADALGFKFVRGAVSHLYLERWDPGMLESLGLIPIQQGQRIDVFVRVPSLRESVFRPAVRRDGVAVCDVLQVWLDAGHHPVRGQEQAQEIWRHVLVPLWKRGLK
jgi:hypothetical protein